MINLFIEEEIIKLKKIANNLNYSYDDRLDAQCKIDIMKKSLESFRLNLPKGYFIRDGEILYK